MNFEFFNVYKVTGSQQITSMRALHKKERDRQIKRIDFMLCHGFKSLYSMNGRLVGGLRDTAPVDPVWKPHKKIPRLWLPNPRSTTGKEMQRALARLDPVTAGQYAEAAGVKYSHVGRELGLTVLRTSQGFFMADQPYLTVPKSPGIPTEIPGCELLKLSEFYSLKEAAEADTATELPATNSCDPGLAQSP